MTRGLQQVVQLLGGFQVLGPAARLDKQLVGPTAGWDMQLVWPRAGWYMQVMWPRASWYMQVMWPRASWYEAQSLNTWNYHVQLSLQLALNCCLWSTLTVENYT